MVIEFLYQLGGLTLSSVTLPTSINCLALVIAASCLTWFITAALGSEDNGLKRLLMLVVGLRDFSFSMMFW